MSLLPLRRVAEAGSELSKQFFPSKGAEQTQFQVLLPHCAGPEATPLLWAQRNLAAKQQGQKGPPKASPRQGFLQAGVKFGPGGSNE